MSPIVILAGYSTAGKSTFLNQLAPSVNCVDTDQLVSTQLGFENIYEVFMTHGRDRAHEMIEKCESKLLRSLKTCQDTPLLMAAGPKLFFRDDWPCFYETRRPFVIHLSLTTEEAHAGLLSRRSRHLNDPNLDKGNDNFGSWDCGVMTFIENGLYVELPREKALENIDRDLAETSAQYVRFEHFERNAIAFRKEAVLRKEVVDQVKFRLHL